MTNYIRKYLFPTLADELAKVLESTPELEKLGWNDEDPEDEYAFLRIVDICKAFREKLLARGIVIVSTDKDCKFELLETPNGKPFERCTVITEFAIRRKKEVLELGAALGSARDYRHDKALAIAETAAYKAFLKRLSMQYGKADDPEARRLAPTDREHAQIASYQGRAFRAAVKQSGKTESQIEESLTKAFGFPVTSDSIIALPRKQFDHAIELITKDSDLSGEWGEAVKYEQARKRGPQQVVSILDKKAKDEVAG